MRRSIIVLLIIITSLAPALATTNTTLNVTNSPPTLTQNIPDLLIIMNEANLDKIDLDDYFLDLNGDTLTFDHTTLNNVTVTINSENQVSFYPDIGYTGTQTMQFNVTDGKASAQSNIFTVTVGLDTQPPQWSSPKKNRVTVYQNYQVTFTTEWTDNTELKEYIFSINQGLGWRNQTTTSFTGSENTSSFKIQISASPSTEVQWTFYATDIYGNMNKVDIQSFIVKEYTYDPDQDYDEDTEYEGSDDEDEAESGASTGEGTYGEGTKLDYFKEGVLAENLEVDTRSIKVSMKQGSNLTKVVKIINTGNTKISLDISLSNINSLAMLSDNFLEINPGETEELLVEFSIPMTIFPDQYFGFLILDYEQKISIPIVVDVKEFESEVTINVNLTKNSKIMKAGEKVTALITIDNIKDISQTDSQLYYAIKNLEGFILESKHEDIVLPSTFEEERSLTLPETVSDGEYIFYARIISEDSIDLDSELFLVGTKFQIIFFIKNLFYPLTILLLLIILFLLYLVYKRNKKKKRLLELYLLLNELRALVKEGKTTEAMDIYKRIKITYGQHVTEDFLKDEVKLKEELQKFSEILKKQIAKPKTNPTPNPNIEQSSQTKKPEKTTKKPTKTSAPSPPKPTSSPTSPAKNPETKTTTQKTKK